MTTSAEEVAPSVEEVANFAEEKGERKVAKFGIAGESSSVRSVVGRQEVEADRYLNSFCVRFRFRN